MDTSFRTRNLLLLADEADIARQIEHALATFHLNHDLQWFTTLDAFQASSLNRSDIDVQRTHVDLCLIAYVGDTDRTRGVLADLRRLPRWQLTPIVVFLPSANPRIRRVLYQLGANSVMTYPLRFDSLRELIETMDRFWFEVASLPPSPD